MLNINQLSELSDDQISEWRDSARAESIRRDAPHNPGVAARKAYLEAMDPKEFQQVWERLEAEGINRDAAIIQFMRAKLKE